MIIISLSLYVSCPFLYVLPGLSSYNQSTVACGRIMKFLDSDDLVSYVTSKPASEVGDGVMVGMSDASFSWSLEPSVDSSNETEAAGPIRKGDQYSKVSDIEDIDATAVLVAQDEKDAVPENIEDFYDQPPVERDSMHPDMSIEANTVLHKAPPPIISAELLVNRSMHTLTDITFSIRKGELVAVVGAVGSGKSSLLNALLGEMLVTKGSVELNGSVAFCDQRPWILNDTVQNNITFGLSYDENRFDSALHYSSLEDDIIVLPGGINTQIGRSDRPLLYCVNALVQAIS
jgi:ABC-type multidrug transport system fused ATPase/permease subunit